MSQRDIPHETAAQARASWKTSATATAHKASCAPPRERRTVAMNKVDLFAKTPPPAVSTLRWNHATSRATATIPEPFKAC
jgi:hypothetical protein